MLGNGSANLAGTARKILETQSTIGLWCLNADRDSEEVGAMRKRGSIVDDLSRLLSHTARKSIEHARFSLLRLLRSYVSECRMSLDVVD